MRRNTNPPHFFGKKTSAYLNEMCISAVNLRLNRAHHFFGRKTRLPRAPYNAAATSSRPAVGMGMGTPTLFLIYILYAKPGEACPSPKSQQTHAHRPGPVHVVGTGGDVYAEPIAVQIALPGAELWIREGRHRARAQCPKSVSFSGNCFSAEAHLLE